MAVRRRRRYTGGAAPLVVAARTDSVAFTGDDWAVLNTFITDTFDAGPRRVTRADFASFVRLHMACELENDHTAHAFIDVAEILDVRYPRGARVKAVDLCGATELNRRTGTVTGKYERGRVGIAFPSAGIKALRPQNIAPEFTFEERQEQLRRKCGY